MIDQLGGIALERGYHWKFKIVQMAWFKVRIG